MSRPHWHPEARYATVLKGMSMISSARRSTAAARCPGSEQASPEDAEALKQLGEIVKALIEKKVDRRPQRFLFTSERQVA